MEGYIFLPPEGHRATARQLARMANYQVISFDNKKNCKLKANSLVVNWGNSLFPRMLKPDPVRIYNPPQKLSKGISKIQAFGAFNAHKVPCPDWTTDEAEAKKWYDEGHVVYTRTIVSGTNGDGIIVQAPGTVEKPRMWQHISNAKFHTKRFKCKEEYRVHVWGDEVIHLQQKKKRKDHPSPDADFYVKNVDNGYIFAIQDVELSDAAQKACIAAVQAVGMDFAAVDVGFKPSNGEFCVFEINSRPALSGTTLIKYADKLKELVK